VAMGIAALHPSYTSRAAAIGGSEPAQRPRLQSQ